MSDHQWTGQVPVYDITDSDKDRQIVRNNQIENAVANLTLRQ